MQLRHVLSQAVLPSLHAVLLGPPHTGKHSIKLTEQQLTVFSVYINRPYTLFTVKVYRYLLKCDVFCACNY